MCTCTMYVWVFEFVALTISIYALVDTGKLPELINDLLFQLCWCGSASHRQVTKRQMQRMQQASTYIQTHHHTD